VVRSARRAKSLPCRRRDYVNPAHDRYNLAGIADGITDPRYNGHRPYWTRDNDPNQPPGGDFYSWSSLHGPLDRVVFYEGDLVPAQVNDNPFTARRDAASSSTWASRCGAAGVVSGAAIQPERASRSICALPAHQLRSCPAVV
jgi:hypothetical protein